MAKKSSGKKIPTSIKNSDLVEERREQIFVAAVRLIQEKGYNNTTLRDISRETGIGLGSLYDYISTKEDILYLVHEKAIALVNIARNEKKSELSDPIENLRELIQIELDVMDKYQDLILSLYQESHCLTKPSLKYLLEKEEEHLSVFKQAIDEGIKLGVFKQYNSYMLTHIIKAVIDSWVLKRWAFRKKVDLSMMKEGIVDMILNGILKD